jgi:hypothetical protein
MGREFLEKWRGRYRFLSLLVLSSGEYGFQVELATQNFLMVNLTSQSFLHSDWPFLSLSCEIIRVWSTDITGKPWGGCRYQYLYQLELKGEFEKDLNNDWGDGESKWMVKRWQRRKDGG